MLICSNCGYSEEDLHQELYRSFNPRCPLRLCSFCRIKADKCPREGCDLTLSEHQLKTQFTHDYNDCFQKLRNNFYEQMEVRKQVFGKYLVELKEIDTEEFKEYLEQLIDFKIEKKREKRNQSNEYQNDKLNYLKTLIFEVKSKIAQYIAYVRQQRLMEIEDESQINRKAPRQLGKVINKMSGAGVAMDERLFHKMRFRNGF